MGALLELGDTVLFISVVVVFGVGDDGYLFVREVWMLKEMS